jgi:hypothetical protein
MKKIFAIIMSFQLILMPVAFAADTPAYGGYTVPGTEEASTGASDAYKKTGTGASGGYDFYVSQIMTLATSAIGGSIISQCLEGLKTPSIATFMAGSVVHMMSEILGAKAKNERHHKKLSDLRLKIEDLKKEGDVSQKAALEAMLVEEKDTLKFLENRKKWMIAVTVIYTAAMGLAIAEEVYGLASGSSTAGVACTAYTASCTVGAAFCGTHCTSGVTAAIAKAKAVTSLPSARTTLTALCTSFTPALAGCQGFVQTYLNLVYGSCLMLPTDGGASMLSWGTLLSLAYGFGSSKLGAGGGQISQYGSMLITLLNMFVPSFSKLVVSMYNFPIPRSITFGAAAVFSGTVTAGLATREGKARGNVSDLENVIREFKVNTEGTEGIAVAEVATETDDETQDPKKKKEPKKLAIDKKKECFSKGSKGFELSSAGCARPIKITKSNFGQFKFPAIGKVGSMSESMAEALASGNDAQAAEIAGEIGAYAARVKAETDQLKAAYNNIEKKNNRPTKDFDKSIKDQVASLQTSLNQAAAKNNFNLASMAKLSGDEVTTDKSSDTPVVTTSAGEPAVVLPDADPLAGMQGSEEAVEPLAAETKAEQSLDEFESTEQDVSKRPEVSIFKQLSNRYILNYTKLFERKKDPEVIEEPRGN